MAGTSVLSNNKCKHTLLHIPKIDMLVKLSSESEVPNCGRGFTLDDAVACTHSIGKIFAYICDLFPSHLGGSHIVFGGGHNRIV